MKWESRRGIEITIRQRICRLWSGMVLLLERVATREKRSKGNHRIRGGDPAGLLPITIGLREVVLNGGNGLFEPKLGE